MSKIRFKEQTKEQLETRRSARLKRDKHEKKMRTVRTRQRSEWSLNTFQGRQIRKMGFRTPYVGSEPDWYREYLKTDHWKQIKEKYYNSDMPQECTICGDTVFDLHHRTYDRIGAENLNDLVPLCRSHHKATHKLVKAGSSLWDAHEKLRI
jgi:hypothetical protein